MGLLYREMYVERYIERCMSMSANATKLGVIMLIPCTGTILYYNPSTDFGEKSGVAACKTDGKREREKEIALE